VRALVDAVAQLQGDRNSPHRNSPRRPQPSERQRGMAKALAPEGGAGPLGWDEARRSPIRPRRWLVRLREGLAGARERQRVGDGLL
jgi:hypothetical protein